MNRMDALDVIDLLQRYYARQLVNVASTQWALLNEYGEGDFAASNPAVAAALASLSAVDSEQAEAFKYDFNRLFVGPDALLAPPYATSYLTEDGTLMRKVTLSVRDEYARFGMQVDAKNVEPDDHFAYELRFLGLLAESTDPDAEASMKRFLDQHVCKWLGPHVQAVRENSANQICLAFADLLEATVTALK